MTPELKRVIKILGDDLVMNDVFARTAIKQIEQGTDPIAALCHVMKALCISRQSLIDAEVERLRNSATYIPRR